MHEYLPPTNNPDDCKCGGHGSPTGYRLAIFCPCCDGAVRMTLPEGAKLFTIQNVAEWHPVLIPISEEGRTIRPFKMRQRS